MGKAESTLLLLPPITHFAGPTSLLRSSFKFKSLLLLLTTDLEQWKLTETLSLKMKQKNPAPEPHHNHPLTPPHAAAAAAPPPSSRHLRRGPIRLPLPSTAPFVIQLSTFPQTTPSRPSYSLQFLSPKKSPLSLLLITSKFLLKK